ncbi:MAG TPA: glycine betaine ABC transporter substrate-binding protein [Terriglobia bacterium]|nr:glycine betaine ABC transporter substrate-binding protein [Terriglobia bacterium]
MSRHLLALFCAAALAVSCGKPDRIVIGSKNFTEQVILGELLAQQIERTTQLAVERKLNLGGTFICHQALVAGQIDAYVEYTGTALTAILKKPVSTDAKQVLDTVRREYQKQFNTDWTEPLGFNNTFVIVVRGDDALKLQLKTISDAAPHTEKWVAGFGYEFIEREDGYPGLSKLYNLRFPAAPRVMDLGLTYRALASGQVDVIAGNSTDGLIDTLHLLALEDDRHYFPPYDAVPLLRNEVAQKHPEVRKALAALGGKVSESDMRRLNYQVDGEHRDVPSVVREFLAGK